MIEVEKEKAQAGDLGREDGHTKDNSTVTGEKQSLDFIIETATLDSYPATLSSLRGYELNAITKKAVAQIARRLDLDVFDIIKDIEKGETKKKTPRLVSFPDLLKEPEEAVAYLVEPLLPVQSIMLLTGRRANFKSIFALDLARAVSTGSPLVGWPTNKSKVVIVDMENRPRLTKRRLIELGTPPEADIHFLLRRDVQSLNIETDHSLLADLCKDSIVIIDTLSKIHMRDENKNSDMTLVMSALLNLIESKAIKALVILHHQGKNTELGGRGASVIEDNPDIVVELLRTGAAARFKCTKHREVSEEELTRDLKFEFGTDSIRVLDVGNEEFFRFLRAFEALPSDNMKTQADLIESLQEQGWTREGIVSMLDQGVRQEYLSVYRDRKHNNSKRYSLKLDAHMRLANGEL